jgi:hypothetical protein
LRHFHRAEENDLYQQIAIPWTWQEQPSPLALSLIYLCPHACTLHENGNIKYIPHLIVLSEFTLSLSLYLHYLSTHYLVSVSHFLSPPSLHLDVGFGEDLDRKRAGYAAQNFSVLNRIALNLLKQDKTSKRGIHGKRLKAGWDNDYLLHLLGN